WAKARGSSSLLDRTIRRIGAGAIHRSPSVVVGAVDRGADVAMEREVDRDLLCGEDHRHIVERIDPEQHRRIAVPEEFADRAAILFGRQRRPRSDEDIEAEAAIALASQPLPLVLADARVEV